MDARWISATPACQIVSATQDVVDSLIAMNTRNRSLRRTVVEAYRRFIQSGSWTITNQGIGVSASGLLIDGQHRLAAMREENYPALKILVVTGLPEDAVAAVDIGKNRNAQDYLHFLFENNVSALVAAILRTMMLYRDGFPSNTTKYSPHEYAAEFETYGHSIEAVLSIPQRFRTPAPVLAALVVAHNSGLAPQVIEFTNALFTGEMLERDNPALILRSWLNRTTGRGGAGALQERFQKTKAALDAFVADRPLLKLYGSKRAFRAQAARAQSTT